METGARIVHRETGERGTMLRVYPSLGTCIVAWDRGVAPGASQSMLTCEVVSASVYDAWHDEQQAERVADAMLEALHRTNDDVDRDVA